MYFHQSAALAGIAAAFGSVPSGIQAFIVPPQQNVAQRTPALGVETLSHFMEEAAGAVGEMKKTAQEAEQSEIETLREQARLLEDEAIALEQEAIALEEEAAALTMIAHDEEAASALESEIKPVEDEATPMEVAVALESEITPVVDEAAPLEAALALEALSTLEDDNSKAEIEKAKQSEDSAEMNDRQVRNVIENRASMRMSLRERLNQIETNTSVVNPELAKVKAATLPEVDAVGKGNSAQNEKVVNPVTRKTASLRDLVSPR
eukprot:CAMPEP_0201634746 /NCGR_PEP_ID=MMETSP0493-20130528/7552_1 /ASSEMBLY_ACC=CAM_ASM_000838 /TAXON_ID=420259 /ORGANISM="Thalassiosira gravida, Strain GMp14c1" /LENGTH=263 /DNA_ID=CAMNT_0048106629 /DNA_START=18 /DNA_END=809 /DNA_ORIENTATION=-